MPFSLRALGGTEVSYVRVVWRRENVRDTVAGVLFVAICERAEPRDARAASDVTQRHGEVYYEKSLFLKRGSACSVFSKKARAETETRGAESGRARETRRERREALVFNI